MRTVFPFLHNWREPYHERRAYRTAVFTSANGSEQRQQLRTIPTRRDELQVSALETTDAAHVAAVLAGAQATQWAVPDWPRTTMLLEGAAAGSDVVLACDTTHRDFRVGGLAVLHDGSRRFALATVTAVAADHVTVDALEDDWPAGRTDVLPAALAHWSDDADAERAGRDVAEFTAAFDYEPSADPAIATPTMPAVFALRDPNGRARSSEAFARTIDRVTSPTYTFAEFARAAMPTALRRRVLLTLPSRVEIAALRTWFDGLKGSLAAFWFPTFQADLNVTGGLGTSTITIARCGYAAHAFPHEARRHLAFLPDAGAPMHRRVLTAVDNGAAAGTETLTLTGSAPAGTTCCSYLLYARLAADELALRWESPEVAECELGIQELAAQVPTTT